MSVREGSPILPQICEQEGPTFMTRKKASVPKMVNRGWYHSNHRFWGSGSAGQGGDEFRVINAHELLSNRECKCSAMDSCGGGQRVPNCPLPTRVSPEGDAAIAEIQPHHLKSDPLGSPLESFGEAGMNETGPTQRRQ